MYGDRNFGGRNNNRGGFNDRQVSPPVKEGDEIDVTVEAVGEKGDGIAKQKGFVLFVPGTKAGDRVHVKITRVLPKVGFTQVLGPAIGPVQEESKPQKQEFQPNEDLDSENFGDESGSSSDDEQETREEEEL